ncbi:MAG: Fe-S cluster assembly protein SufD [Acidobacteria bacterium RIFCSPLOWO2_02_FULL_59_13]|nr:MAG: Fe-S cluster assembly protein SufD [Acidobacteria bacterium RIFCSPLOWO2_02_FULL_59_13]
MPDVMEQQDLYLSGFREQKERLARQEPAWLHRMRQEAIERFAELGFPTTHQEEWKYTNVAPLAKIPFQLSAPEEACSRCSRLSESARAPGMDSPGIRLVFYNGCYCADLSSLSDLPSSVRAGSLAESVQGRSSLLEAHLARYADYRSHPFIALNTAFWRDGAFIRIPSGVVLQHPIHLVYISAAAEVPVVSFPRTLILAERDSQLTVMESYLGLPGGVCFSNAVSEIVLGENAVVDHYKLALENEQSYHLDTLQVYQDRSSNFKSCSLALGGSLVRNEVNVVLDAEGCDCTLNGLYIAMDHQLVDNRTMVDHARPHGTSRQLYHGILGDSGTGVFNGRIVVRPNAQKTDAVQRNRNLLLSEDAVIDTKPQLEIFANDVRCTHGATIGQLDPESLFYLCSRGIGLEEARQLLIDAFAGAILERIRPAPMRSRVEETLHAMLWQGRHAEEAL